MKKVIISRIHGYALLAFFVGMFANHLFSEKALIFAVPTALVWLMIYDERTFRWQFGDDDNE